MEITTSMGDMVELVNIYVMMSTGNVFLESIYTNPSSTYQYFFAPNDKCVAFQTSYYSTYYKEDYTYVTTHSCRETINDTTKE